MKNWRKMFLIGDIWPLLKLAGITLLVILILGLLQRWMQSPVLATVSGLVVSVVFIWFGWLAVQWQSREMWYDLRMWWRMRHRAKMTPRKTETTHRPTPPRGTTELATPEELGNL